MFDHDMNGLVYRLSRGRTMIAMVDTWAREFEEEIEFLEKELARAVRHCKARDSAMAEMEKWLDEEHERTQELEQELADFKPWRCEDA